MHDTLHIEIFVVLLLISSAVCATVKWIKLPYSVALVIVGLIIGVFHLLPPFEMTPDLVMLIFLPAMLFEASWNIHVDELKATWIPIAVLATVGVLLSTLVIAGSVFSLGALSWPIGLLFGAMISATDPISVLALFRKLGINKRLTMILEGESLFNDGTAVVLFSLILPIVTSTLNFSLAAALGSFTVVVAGGAIVGVALGLVASKVTSYFDDHLLEITLTTVLAYGSYLMAEQLHVSPVIAVVVAGIVIGNYGSRSSMSATTRLAVNSFWEYAAFVVNSLVFLLIGMQVKADLLIKYSLPTAAAIVAILAGRALIIYILCPALSTKTRPIPWTWRHLLFWGGLRGALCMALALSLPRDLTEREPLIIITFGVVLFTLLVQGLTIEPLVQLFKMTSKQENLDRYSKLRALLLLNSRAQEMLRNLKDNHSIGQETFDKLRQDFEEKAEIISIQLRDLHMSDDSIQLIESTNAERRLLELQKDELAVLVRDGQITNEIAQELRADLNSKLQTLDQE